MLICNSRDRGEALLKLFFFISTSKVSKLKFVSIVVRLGRSFRPSDTYTANEWDQIILFVPQGPEHGRRIFRYVWFMQTVQTVLDKAILHTFSFVIDTMTRSWRVSRHIIRVHICYIFGFTNVGVVSSFIWSTINSAWRFAEKHIGHSIMNLEILLTKLFIFPVFLPSRSALQIRQV